MTKYFLTQWEAIELFCKIVSKYENISIDVFHTNGPLILKLLKYESDRLSTDFAKKCLKPIADETGQATYYPKALYDLSQEIRFTEPIVRSSNRLMLLLKYINEENTIGTYKALNSAWLPNDKQRMFEKTSWYLYYYEEYKDRGGNNVRTGITRSLVQLLSFARLVIKNIDASDGEPGKEEEFRGKYSIYDGERGQEHLLLEGRLGDAQERDLHILVYIGTGEFKIGEIALGQYHNASKAIYSGTVIMEKIEYNSGANPQFFGTGDPGIEPVLWDYFRNKNQNRVRTRQGITKKNVLQDWINSKK